MESRALLVFYWQSSFCAVMVSGCLKMHDEIGTVEAILFFHAGLADKTEQDAGQIDVESEKWCDNKLFALFSNGLQAVFTFCRRLKAA